MPDTNITTAAAPATLTEQELFAVFLNLHIQHYTNFGTLAADYMPSEFLHEPGEYGELLDVTEMLADDLANDERPEEALLSLANSLEVYAEQVRTVWRDFAHYKGAHLTEADLGDEPEDQSGEEYKAWSAAWDEQERNPRFRVPALKAEGEAA